MTTRLENFAVIPLPKGDDLEIHYSSEFLDIIKRHFKLECTPSDDHIRMFIHGAVDSAIRKAERHGL